MPGRRFEVQASTNLAGWSPLGVVTNATVLQPFMDATAPAHARFYRLRELP
jgi:hypothetical protein